MKMTSTWFTPALLTLALFAGACGKKNESGKGSSKNNRYWGAVGTYTGVAPANTNNPYIQQVFQRTMCTTGGNSRIGTGQLMNFGVAANSSYVGITAEGDIAVLTGDNSGRAVLSLYVCPRPTAGQGSITMYQNPAYAPTAAGCRVDQITAANVYVPGAMPGYPFELKFFAIHFNPQLRSTLCAY